MSTLEGKELIHKENMRHEELQMSLMKMVSEQNKEKFLEYDCETDVAVMSVIENGHFREIERIDGYYAKYNLSISRVAEEDRALYRREVERCLKSARTRVIELRYLSDAGEKIWYRVYMVSLADKERKVIKLAARFISIHKEREAQELMKSQAERDSLSGVYNRKTYEKLCEEIIEKNSDGLLFVMIDIDNFKQINDRHGHHAGDSVVCYVGKVLQIAVKGRGVAGRIGGDEFSVCLYGIEDKNAAMDACVRIREALRQTLDGLSFTVSMGAATSNARGVGFKQLYFEADKAVYYAKDHGKNQVVFVDEIEEKKKRTRKKSQKEYTFSQEEMSLDMTVDYCVIVNPSNKKIVYMNKAARDILGMSIEEAQDMHCYELFKSRESECGICELYGTHINVLEGENSCGLSEYIPNGKFIIKSSYTTWSGRAARLVNFMDVNDSLHVKQCLEELSESQDALSRSWSVICDPNTQELEYEKVLEVLNNYYEADCCAIILKNEDTYDGLYEFHKDAGASVVDMLKDSLGTDDFEQYEKLIDENGHIKISHMKKSIPTNSEIQNKVEVEYMHNAIGIKLSRLGDMVGILLVINPKHHMDDYNILTRIGIFFTTDLLRKRLSDDKDYESKHDILTGFWSRDYFATWQKRSAYRYKKNYGVCTSDVFRLGDINREFGYENGNKRLVELAEVYRRVFGGYAIFRYDDDQILAVCHNVDKQSFEKIINYAKEVLNELHFEVSFGYSWTADGELADVIRDANNYLDRDRDRLEVENDFEGKLSKKVEKDTIEQVEKGNFKMFLQPKVSAKTGETVGAEGLIRLYDEIRGYVSPAFFIPVLEEHNAIHVVDLFMLRQAFQFQAIARNEGRKMVPISVNFSKNTLIYKDLLEYIKQLCDEYGMPEGMIRIEITETISSMDHFEISKIAKALHNIGFSISMDDFGTKYSNMAVLTQFDFDTVKIDRSMILDIVENEKNQTVLRHMVNMFRELGLEIVIEGVETAEQVEVLKGLGCDIIQGFYFGRPESEEKFYDLYM